MFRTCVFVGILGFFRNKGFRLEGTVCFSLASCFTCLKFSAEQLLSEVSHKELLFCADV